MADSSGIGCQLKASQLSVNTKDRKPIAKPIEEWRGVCEFHHAMLDMTIALIHRVPEDVAVSMANLQACIDWFQVDNQIELSSQRIEAEFNRYDELFDEVTTRQWPPADRTQG